MDAANLQVKRVIAHRVHMLAEDRGIVPPILSSRLTTLNDDGSDELRDRIVGAVGEESRGMPMVISDSGEESFYALAAEGMQADDLRFIALSKEAAHMLTKAQTSRRIPGGILVVFSGTVGSANNPYFGVIKAEVHGGFATRQASGVVTMEHVKDLLLTPLQKLYKIGFFVNVNGGNSVEDHTALIYDHNVTTGDDQAAARYFYGGFLGLSLPKSAARQTREFFELTKEFISDAPITAEKRVDLYNHLYSELRNQQRTTLSARHFSDEYMPATMRQGYRDFMKSHGFASQSIHKDTSGISHKLKRRKVRFTNDILVTGPSDSFGDNVKIESGSGAQTIIKIRGGVVSQE